MWVPGLSDRTEAEATVAGSGSGDSVYHSASESVAIGSGRAFARPYISPYRDGALVQAGSAGPEGAGRGRGWRSQVAQAHCAGLGRCNPKSPEAHWYPNASNPGLSRPPVPVRGFGGRRGGLRLRAPS
jgi:hypothetical protein